MASSGDLRSPPARRCSRCCATAAASSRPRTAARRRGSAAAVWRSSTATPRPPARSPPRRPTAHEILTSEGVAAEERELIATRLRRGGRPPVRILHPRLRAARQVAARPATRDRPASRSPRRSTGTSAAAPATSRSSTRSSGWRALARGEPLPEPCMDGRVGQPLARYGAAAHALGDRPYVDDLQRARHAPRRGRARRRTPGRGCCAIDTSRGRARCPASPAVADRRRRARASAGTACSTTTGRASWPRAKRCAASATCWRRSPPTTRRTARAAAELVEVEYEPLPAAARSHCGARAGRAAGQPEARQPAVAHR